MANQQSKFEADLQTQIADAQAQTEELRSEFAAETSAATAASATETSAYTTTAQQTEVPASAQTTTPIKKKKEEKSSLRISSGSTPQAAGSGLNIGV